MKFLLPLILLITLFACHSARQNVPDFSPSKIPAQSFTIDTRQDTVLQTAQGVLLKIPAGTLETTGENKATLEIREAISMSQIISAGLFTQSDGKPLSSGGMIYIGAKDGQAIRFQKKIQVAIPTDYLDSRMERYQGEPTADGGINWTKPDTLPANAQMNYFDEGKTLFQSKCAPCHQIGKDATGPDLAHFMKRFPMEEEGRYQYYYHRLDLLRHLLLNENTGSDSSTNTALEHAIYIYKCNLQNMYGSTATLFSDLIDDSGKYMSIFRYIQSESDRLDLPMPAQHDLSNCADSCETYLSLTAEIRSARNQTIADKKQLIAENGEMTVVNPDSLQSGVSAGLTAGNFDWKVSPENYAANYYQFSVSSFGWYNIDKLLDDPKEAPMSSLFATITGDFQTRTNLFLIIPSAKVYGEGGPASVGQGRYAFFAKDGDIPLPQGVTAYVLAVSEQDDKIAYGLKKFTTSRKQEITVDMHESSKQEFEKAMSAFDRQRLHISVEPSKNADSIRAKVAEITALDKKLKEVESLRPKNCDCTCNTLR